MTTIFGQLVVGPPGSGKSTYCKFINDNLKQLGRNSKIINLDPANDCLSYKPAIDIAELINVQDVMTKFLLGPNGSMIHCIEYLDKHFDWLADRIASVIKDDLNAYNEARKANLASDDPTKHRPYLLFDCPGQSELYTHHTAMRSIIKKLTDKNALTDLRLVCLNLCDAHYASDLGKYIGVLMNSLSTMLNLELPHINILSKVDLVEKYGKVRFNIDFYCEVLDLKYLIDGIDDDPFYEKHKKLTKAIADVIQDYSLVTFVPLNIKKAEDILKVLQLADKANGYHIDDLDLAILQQNPKLAELAAGRRV